MDCFELNNFTVIDLHVVHLINVVDDLAKERKEKKRDILQLFTNRQVNFTTKKVQKWDCRATFFVVVVCH